MSQIIYQMIEQFDLNKNEALKGNLEKLEEMEKKSRSLYFIGENIKTSNLNQGAQLGSIIQEVFLDLTNSIFLITYSHHRPAYQSLRSALELTLVAVYFADHPVEFVKWKKDNIDFHFSDIAREISASEYRDAVGSNINLNLSEILSIYRELSQYVHGKFEYLTIVDAREVGYNAERFIKFNMKFENTVSQIINLCIYRFECHMRQAISDYPYIKNFLINL